MVLLEGENPWQETATNSVITNPLLDSNSGIISISQIKNNPNNSTKFVLLVSHMHSVTPIGFCQKKTLP